MLVISRFVLVNDVPSRVSVISYSRKSISSYGRISSSPVSHLIKDVITFYLHEDNLSRRLTPPPLSLPTSHSPRDVYSGPLIPRTLPLDRNLFSSPFILQRQTHWDRCRGIVVEGSLLIWMKKHGWREMNGVTWMERLGPDNLLGPDNVHASLPTCMSSSTTCGDESL